MTTPIVPTLDENTQTSLASLKAVAESPTNKVSLFAATLPPTQDQTIEPGFKANYTIGTDDDDQEWKHLRVHFDRTRVTDPGTAPTPEAVARISQEFGFSPGTRFFVRQPDGSLHVLQRNYYVPGGYSLFRGIFGGNENVVRITRSFQRITRI